ncbi:MAG TPA: hypothetical protein VHC22_09020 [Pirellulales bacterium]|nr:hypothetical protein [Pirellulales bacterium]
MNCSRSKFQTVLAAAILIAPWASAPVLAADAFRPGDSFVVAQAGAPLMSGRQTLATLSQGQRLSVLRTEGDWVGTTAVVNGKSITGWVHQRQVTTPAQYAQRQTTRRRYSYQAGSDQGGGYASPSRNYSRSSSSSGGRLIMGVTPYGPSYWRADRKIKGY